MARWVKKLLSPMVSRPMASDHTTNNPPTTVAMVGHETEREAERARVSVPGAGVEVNEATDVGAYARRSSDPNVTGIPGC